ncbi:MAG: hypothetical protein ACRD6X_11105 [Pyrinomonadaceae bacterium]
MTSKFFATITVSIIYFAAGQAAISQIKIGLPKLPKIAQPKTEQREQDQARKVDQSLSIVGNNVDEATIAKDSVQVIAFTFSSYRKNNSVWSWVPKIEYRVNGPLASGSQLSVEFNMPGSGPWVKLDCKTEATQAGFSFKTECGGREIPEDKGSTYTGPVNFSIRMRNELVGTDLPLFTGKMKVSKVRSNETAPNTVNHFVYYVDHDWNLPIGYLFYEGDNQWDLDDPRRWAKPKFSIAFWTRGESSGFAEPHLFFGGKEVGKAYYNGGEVGVPNCSVTEAQNNTTHITQPEGQFKWTRWKCTFYNVIPWNKTRDSNETLFGRLYLFSENPGAYEMKVLHNGKLIRSFKFDVGSDGKLVDNGIAKTNKLGSDRIIVPVQVLGDQDGTWDRNAWKTDAFYGNPLNGFELK